jgi:uncharacterized membrane protein
MNDSNSLTSGTSLPGSKIEAQHRTDRINSFVDELEYLEKAGILSLSNEQKAAVADYHADLLSELVNRFDIDTNATARQMSMGMRIVSFLGALALSAAVFFFFYRYWGLLSTTSQTSILIAAPLLILSGVEFAARRERTLYFASLISLVAFAAFVLNLSMLGQIFSITPSQNAFLVWGAFALIIAYTYRLRLMLVAGLICLMGYLAATIGTWSGMYWLSFGERPENFIIAGLIIFVAAFIPQHKYTEFLPSYRIFGLLAIFIAILILSHWGMGSYLPLSPKQIENCYQIGGFILAGLVIWLGIRCFWHGVTNVGSTFFVIFLYTKFYDWWWEWLPKYLFFLLMGGIAVGLLFLLRRMRSLIREVSP